MNKLIKPIIGFTAGLAVLGAVGSCTEMRRQNQVMQAGREYEKALHDFKTSKDDAFLLREKLDSLCSIQNSLIVGDTATIEQRAFRSLITGIPLEKSLSREDKQKLKKVESEIQEAQLRLDIVTGKVLEDKRVKYNSLIP